MPRPLITRISFGITGKPHLPIVKDRAGLVGGSTRDLAASCAVDLGGFSRLNASRPLKGTAGSDLSGGARLNATRGLVSGAFTAFNQSGPIVRIVSPAAKPEIGFASDARANRTIRLSSNPEIASQVVGAPPANHLLGGNVAIGLETSGTLSTGFTQTTDLVIGRWQPLRVTHEHPIAGHLSISFSASGSPGVMRGLAGGRHARIQATGGARRILGLPEDDLKFLLEVIE